MASKEPLKHPASRRYTEAEEQAVRLVRQLRKELGTDQGTVGRVARQLGYGVESVRSWVKQAEVDKGLKPGTTTADAERIKALEQENKELKRANEILRRASVCFRGGARPPTEMTVRFIEENRSGLGVEPICKALQVAPSTYYAAKSRPASGRSVRDAFMLPGFGPVPGQLLRLRRPQALEGRSEGRP